MQILPGNRLLPRAHSPAAAASPPSDLATPEHQRGLRQLLPALPARPLRRQRDARARRLQRRPGQRRPLGGPGARRRATAHGRRRSRSRRRANTCSGCSTPQRDYRSHLRAASSASPERRGPSGSPERPGGAAGRDCRTVGRDARLQARLRLHARPPTSRRRSRRWPRACVAGERFQTLLGATGTGKTMTMAGVIEAVQRPTLVIAHNKTLAAQLCNEFRTFFPDNAVEYFVSYYDYYQPEAYVPSRDLYIEKDSAINQEVDRLRHAATAAVFARRDVIVVASVSCIYGLGSPRDLRDEHADPQARRGDRPRRAAAQARLDPVHAQRHACSRAAPSACAARRSRCSPPTPRRPSGRRMFGDEVERLQHFDPLTGELIADDLEHVAIWPATHYNVKEGTIEAAVEEIGARAERALRASWSPKASSSSPTACASAPSTTWRCCARSGFCSGIENYSRILDGRTPGDAAVLPDRLLPRRTSSASSTSPTRRCRRSAACTRATARASRRSSTTASGCRARSTTARRRSRSSSRSPRS